MADIEVLVRGGVPTASSADKWVNCPPSFNLELAVNRNKKTAASEDGELLHEAMERWQGDIPQIASELELDEDQLGLFEKAANWRNKNLERIFGQDAEPLIITENRMYLREQDTILSNGKPDLLACMNGVYYLEDTKFGFVKVDDATANQQLFVLAAMTLQNYPDVKKLFISINQPRFYSTTYFVEVEPSKFDILLAKVKFSAAAAISNLNTGHKAGEWCRYCKAAAVCPLAQSLTVRMEKLKSNIANLSAEQLGQILDATPAIEGLIKQSEEEAISRLVAGQPVAGYTLKPKKLGVTPLNSLPKAYKEAIQPYIDIETATSQKKKIKDEAALLKALANAGMGEADIKRLVSEVKKTE